MIRFFIVTFVSGLAAWLIISILMSAVTIQWGFVAYLSPVPIFLITLGIGIAITEIGRRRSIINASRQKQSATIAGNMGEDKRSCMKCGSELPVNSNFCAKCGAKQD